MVATPAGVEGQGGIDRIMATLKHALEARGERGISVRFVASRGAGSAIGSLRYMLAFCARMLASRLRGRLDLVHINLSQNGSTYRKMVIAAVARMLRVPYVLHLHGADYHVFWPQKGLLNRAIRTLFTQAAQVVVLGSVWRDFVAAKAPGAAGRIAIVPNASAPPALVHRGGGDTVHILFLGRVGARKGVPQLGEALHRLKHLDTWRATIAGDGAVELARKTAAELGIAERVALPGWVGPQGVAELLASADILVLPSFAENLPVSVIEGMGSGLAVVTTPVGAVADIIQDGQSGLLVPPGDVEALTAALEKVVRDPALRQRLGEAAQAVHRERLHPTPFAEAICRIWTAAALAPKGRKAAIRPASVIGPGGEE